MKQKKIEAATNGDCYVPYEERRGEESVVYFTRDLSAEGLENIYCRVCGNLDGKVAVKLHTGEKNGPNIIPTAWVEYLMKQHLSEGTIIETNTYYEGDRYTTALHRETLKVNGWTFAPVDIMDDEGAVPLPVKDGKWFDKMYVGRNLLNYDSMLTLTHFKGHPMGGFGGSNKNIGIGCADAKIGKKMIHNAYDTENDWAVNNEELMERMTESTKSVIDHFGERVVYINVLRNMSVDCDCFGLAAAPVVTPNVGICASLDILAVDQACVDMIYAMDPGYRHAMVERMESRRSLRQLSYMKELGMGNDRYRLIDIDNEDMVITAREAVEDVLPFATI